VLGGLHLGYNWQHNNVVFGVEGDISLTGGLDDYLASLRARFGLATNDTLFYITGGLALRDGGGADAIGLAGAGANGGSGGSNDDGPGGDDPREAQQLAALGGKGGGGGDGSPGSVSGFDGDDGNDTGFVLGAGAEYMLSSNVSVGVEGLWYSFDDEDDLTVIRGRLSLHLDRAPHPGFKDAYAAAAIADWSGFYAGVNVGAGFGDGAASAKTQNGEGGAAGDPGVPSGLPRHKTDGFDDGGGGGGGGGGGAAALITFDDDSSVLGGVHIGYNWQDGSYVFGIEGDANLADENFRDYLASLRLRLGHSFDNVLVYGTAGVAFAGRGGGLASVTLNAAGAGGDGEDGGFENYGPAPGGPGDGAGGAGGDPGTVTTAFDDGEDKVGFVVGGGFEVKLWDRTSLGFEGLYYGFEGDGESSTATSFTASDDLSTAVLRARMTFQLTGEHQSLK
jgi:opacity protein-like surface antigen